MLAHFSGHLVTVRNVVKLVQRLQLNVPAEDVALDPKGQRLADLVVHVNTSRHGKDVVELLEGALLGLGDPEEDHDQGGHVQATIWVPLACEMVP